VRDGTLTLTLRDRIIREICFGLHMCYLKPKPWAKPKPNPNPKLKPNYNLSSATAVNLLMLHSSSTRMIVPENEHTMPSAHSAGCGRVHGQEGTTKRAHRASNRTPPTVPGLEELSKNSAGPS
jgi:hypothetical protein